MAPWGRTHFRIGALTGVVAVAAVVAIVGVTATGGASSPQAVLSGQIDTALSERAGAVQPTATTAAGVPVSPAPTTTVAVRIVTTTANIGPSAASPSAT